MHSRLRMSSNGTNHRQQADRLADIRQRVKEAENQNGGEVRPYETLGLLLVICFESVYFVI
jgi:hypothetical protein